MVQQKLTLAGLLAVLGLFVSSQVFAQADVIDQRIKLMKSNSAASKAIKAAVAEKDYATIELKAKDIVGNLDKALDLFPKGSTSAESRAKAEIWEKWDEFGKDMTAAKKAATELAEAAASKNESLVESKFKALGQACSSCHKPFRAEKKN